MTLGSLQRILSAMNLPEGSCHSTIPLAGTVVLDLTGRVLLLHRCVPGHEQWELPGGKVKAGEAARDAAVREIKEELGIEVRVVRRLGNAAFQERMHEWHYEWFLAEAVSGSPAVQEPHKHDEWRFFSWEELLDMDPLLSPNTRNLLKAVSSRSVVL